MIVNSFLFILESNPKSNQPANGCHKGSDQDDKGSNNQYNAPAVSRTIKSIY